MLRRASSDLVQFYFRIDTLTARCKSEPHANGKCYTTLNICYIIHTFSSVMRFLCLSDLKKEGVKPVIFLN
jgi:hypothetical protein